MTNTFQTRTREKHQKKIAQAISRVESAGQPTAAEQLRGYADRIASQVKPSTLETYATQLSKICRATGKAPDDLTNDDLRAHFKTLDGMSNGTKYSVYQALRSYFCDYRHYDRQMNSDLTSRWETLMANIKRPSITKRLMSDDDLIKPDDLNRLIRAARNTRDKAFIAMLFETGARIGELASVEVKDVRLDSTPVKVYIRHSKTEDKAGRRVVYLINSIPYLKRWLEEHPKNMGEGFYTSNVPLWLTLNRTGRPPTIGAWSVVIKRAGEAAGVNKRLFHHLFRHSRAYDLSYNYGLGLKEIKETLGHTQIQTTDGYLTINKDLMIQKLMGGTDEAERVREREEAIKAGKPVMCACGEENEPGRAFCHKCGRVVNRKVAREIYAQKESENEALEKRLKVMEESIKALAAARGDVGKLKQAREIARKKDERGAEA